MTWKPQRRVKEVKVSRPCELYGSGVYAIDYLKKAYDICAAVDLPIFRLLRF
jgi:hypothetical protein